MEYYCSKYYISSGYHGDQETFTVIISINPLKYTVGDKIFNIYHSFVVTPFDIFRSIQSLYILTNLMLLFKTSFEHIF